MDESAIEGRNAVLGASRAGKTVDKLYVQEGLKGGPVLSVVREAEEQGSHTLYSNKEGLNHMSEDGKRRGVIAMVASYNCTELGDVFANAREKGEDPFLILLDGIEDPYDLGTIARIADQAGTYGVIINKNHAVRLTVSVARISAGALDYTSVTKVMDMVCTIKELKKEGFQFVTADTDSEEMYSLNLKGPSGSVTGNEGKDVSRLVRKKCNLTVRIPMPGQAGSLNASVAVGMLVCEALRQHRS